MTIAAARLPARQPSHTEPCLNAIEEALRNGTGSVTQLGSQGSKRASFPELHARAGARAALLAERGVGPGARVGIWAKNSIDWLVTDLACLALGARSVPFDVNSKETAEALLERYELSALFVDAPAAGASARVLPIAAPELASSRRALPAWHRFEELESYTTKLTSGTTGDAKAIATTRRHFDHMARHVARLFDLSASDRFLTFLPLSTWLQRFFVHLGILVGFDVVLGRTQSALNALRSQRPTLVVAVPHFLKAVHELHLSRPQGSLAEAWGGALRSLWTGSAPIERSLLDAYLAAGIPVHEGYGMSETGLIAKSYPGAVKPGSVGKPFPDKRIEIDAQGQVLVHSDFHSNTGYSNAPPTEEDSVFRPGGVVATGDVGYLDDEGFLFLTGRVKDMLVLANGKKVAPAPVESRIAGSPLVRSVCVLGSGRPFLTAVIVPVAGAPRAEIERELTALNAAASPHERVYGFHLSTEDFTSELGLRTSTGKLNRRQVAAHFQKEIDALYRTVTT